MTDEYKQIVSECVEQGKALSRYMANNGIFEPMYLYFRRSQEGKGSGKLFLVRDSAPNPFGYELVTGEGLRANVPFENYYTWIYERARRCPILSF